LTFVLGTRFIIKTCLVVTDVDVAPSAVAAPPARESNLLAQSSASSLPHPSSSAACLPVIC
jgi:hypothetical protein